MDEFVRNFLTKYGFANLIDTFRDEEVDKEALFCLGEKEIEVLIPKAGRRAKFNKRLRELQDGAAPSRPEEPAEMTPVPGASGRSGEDVASSSTAYDNVDNVRTRELDPEPATDTPEKIKRQCDTAPGSVMDDLILANVQGIMGGIHDRLARHESTKFNSFLRKKIGDLWTEKRDLVGVFGRTGTGKSYLINAIVGEKDLLPTGSVQACTSVMIKVEANTLNQKYEAEIEFISKAEWRDELWSLLNLFGEIPEEERKDDEEYTDGIDQMTALYGDEWRNKSLENLMEPKYFKEVPEFLKSGKKIVRVELAKELSARVQKYTKNDSSDGKKCFWPLVKCVTVRVPRCALLKHVTLVDLPGNGDRNKSRDQMWKKMVASCSTVWIVSEITRPASDANAWDILETSCSLMGNGGECQKIYFICTKSEDGADDIFKRNLDAKVKLRKEFNKLPKVKKQFKDDCFEVFTVSAKEFFKQEKLQRDETEIPKLRQNLQSLNDQHDTTLNYVTGAHGILSLIQAAKVDSGQAAQVCDKLSEVLQRQLEKIQTSMESVRGEFEKCLSEGVEDSKNESEGALKKKLNPKGGGRSFHRPLKCALQNDGVYKTKTKKQIDLNEAISRFLTDSINEEFRKTFPNDAKSGLFYGAICDFSLDTKQLIQQFKIFELQLTFIETEVATVKKKLCKYIRDGKKTVYSSLAETVLETMQDGYQEAAVLRGAGSLEQMKLTVINHFLNVKDTMFDRAKDLMMSKLVNLMGDVQKQLRDSLQESIDMSLKGDHLSIPDFGSEFNLVKKHLDDLTGQK